MEQNPNRVLIALGKFHEVRNLFWFLYFRGLNYNHNETSVGGELPEHFFARITAKKKVTYLRNPTKNEDELIFMIRLSGENLENFELVFSNKININDKRIITKMFEEAGFVSKRPNLRIVK